jgi:hypothetical protein
MTTKRVSAATALAVLFLVSTNSFAQQAALTSDDIQAAILTGTKNKNKEHGLRLDDVAAGIGGALAQGVAQSGFGDPLSRPSGASSGFRAAIYTPVTWIRQVAAAAARQRRPFTSDDLPSEMLAPVLRVFVYPSTVTWRDLGSPLLTSPRALGASSVIEVSLTDTSEKVVLAPLSKEGMNSAGVSPIGRSSVRDGVVATFDLSALAELRRAGKNSEFVLKVAGPSRSKGFVVKKKHFGRIP